MGKRRQAAPPNGPRSDEPTPQQEVPPVVPHARSPVEPDALPPGPLVVALDDKAALDPELSGAKAANLASAAAAGFRVLPGFALTTHAFDAADPGWGTGGMPEPVTDDLRTAWGGLSDGASVVVRSSSTVEDVGASSMAGQFLSLLGITSWEGLLAAIGEVQRSAAHPAAGGPPAPMAVLVQREVDASVGGVMFGLDPVTGDESRVLVEAVRGGPEHLVSGTVTAQRYLLGRHGRIIEGPAEAEGEELLDRQLRHRLTKMAREAHTAFGRPQDIEWAVDAEGKLWLLQSRPVTATGAAASASGPLLGPGPVGETFPLPLLPLEEDLWLVPLRRGIANAITVTGAIPGSQLAASPLILTVGGRVACDLELIGASPQKPSKARMLDPRVGLRRTVSAWRVGRLRAVLPGLAVEMARRVDAELTEVGPLDHYSSAELLELVERIRSYLAAVHGHEVLAGVLLEGGTGATAAGAAMRALQRGRDLDLTDTEIVNRWPVTLALSAPRIGGATPLPECPTEAGPPATGAWAAELDALPPREALRLRARWLQELSARAVDLIAQRLVEGERIGDAARVGQLSMTEFRDLVGGWPPPPDLAERVSQPGPPLPSCFRLDDRGEPVRVQVSGPYLPGGRGASPGRASGAVVHDPADAAEGDVLVTRTLDPRLALWLPRLGAIVSETGSVLSHLAILAREYEVPAVVGVTDAVDRYPEGIELIVDGGTGEISTVDPESSEVPDADV